MNILLIPPHDAQGDVWFIHNPRQIQHIHKVLQVNVGDVIKVGIENGQRYWAKIIEMAVDKIIVCPQSDANLNLVDNSEFYPQPPAKLPLTLILALPRPKVLRRIVQDSVSLGVQKIVIIQSYLVDKSYWSSPILNELHDAMLLGLEQAQDTIFPQMSFEKRFKPFVEDKLSTWINPNCPAYVAHPYAEQPLPHQVNHECILIIGCERGFTRYEVDLLVKNGCQAVSFGQRILRTETSIPYAIGRLFS